LRIKVSNRLREKRPKWNSYPFLIFLNEPIAKWAKKTVLTERTLLVANEHARAQVRADR
jgi:hypothetical protein